MSDTASVIPELSLWLDVSTALFSFRMAEILSENYLAFHLQVFFVHGTVLLQLIPKHFLKTWHSNLC